MKLIGQRYLKNAIYLTYKTYKNLLSLLHKDRKLVFRSLSHGTLCDVHFINHLAVYKVFLDQITTNPVLVGKKVQFTPH